MAFVCTIASGSDGNCVLVSHQGTHLLVDAGISARRIKQGLWNWGLYPEDIRCVLVTHEHGDHINGLGVLRRPVMAAPLTAGSIQRRFPHLCVTPVENEDGLQLGAIGVLPFPTPHDSPDSLGFSLVMDDKRACVCTDLGHVTRAVLDHATKAHCLLLESNHDEKLLRFGPYPEVLKRRILGPRGHLANHAAADVAAAAVHKGAEMVTLMHLSKENNRPDLAKEATAGLLRAGGVNVGQDMRLEVAPHGEIGVPWGRFA